MSKLMILAREYNCCILLIHHLNKGRGSKAIYRGLGSIDIIAAARSVCLFGYQSENDLDDKVMVHVKHNNSPRGDALTYTLDGGFRWTGKSTLTASDILETKKGSPKTKDAVEFLKNLIAEDEYMSATDVLTARDEADISPEDTNKRQEGTQDGVREDRWCVVLVLEEER